jgi:hypothetical protein
MYNFLATHRKIIIAILGTAINIAIFYFANNPQATIYINIIIGGLTAAGVYQASNQV